MADKEKYIIKVEGQLIEVTPDVYYAYFRMERQEEKKQRNNVISYDALDNEETVGIDSLPDLVSPSPEEAVIAKELEMRLHNAIESLPRAERELIKALFFENKAEQEYANEAGMSQPNVSYQRQRILSKMRKFMNLLGSFPAFLYEKWLIRISSRRTFLLSSLQTEYTNRLFMVLQTILLLMG